MKAIILAAGKGTRMKSGKLKVLHQVAGKPMVNYVLDSIRNLKIKEVYLVVGHQSELIKKTTSYPNIKYVEQNEQLGTGHAVMQVEPHFKLEDDEHVLILSGDCPLIEEATLKNLITTHKDSNSSGTILTTVMCDPAQYGRIVRGRTGIIKGIREAKDCTEQELEIKEINTGIYCFKIKDLFNALKKIDPHNKQNEYYLTDVIQVLKKQGKAICSFCTPNSNEALGINTRHDLAQTNKILYAKHNELLMQEGVTIIDPESTYIDSTVEIGIDTIIYPFTMIEGTTKIGQNCIIGPNAYVKDAEIKANSLIEPFSKLVF